METCFIYDTAIGKITITADEDAVTSIRFGAYASPDCCRSTLTDRAAQEISQYLQGERTVFSVPLCPKGTAFQQLVWKALRSIPYGETRSYKQIAEYIGRPKACRAVGMANNKNPILLMIPCHRVVGADGKLVGFAAGLPLKKQLLQMEAGHCTIVSMP